jgi:hypothetical protein
MVHRTLARAAPEEMRTLNNGLVCSQSFRACGDSLRVIIEPRDFLK